MRWAVVCFGLAVLGLSGCPEMAITPDSAPQGAQSFEIRLQGTVTTWSDGNTQAEFLAPSGIVIQSFEVINQTTAVMFVDIPSGEPIGSQTLQVTTGAEVVEATFTVVAGPGVALFPPSAEQYEFGQQVRIEGTNTTFTAPGFGVALHIPGVTVVGTPTVVSDTEALVVLDVDISAEARVYADAFVVTTNWQDVVLDFEITPVQGRAITLDPDSSDTGEIVNMTITGNKTFFDDASLTWEGMFDIDDWEGLEVVDHKVVSATELYLELWVHTESTPGVRTITVTDVVGALDAEFEVVRDTTAPTVTFAPPSAQPREDPPVVAHGTFTSFSSGDHATTVEVIPANQGFAMVIDQIVDPTTISLRTVIGIEVVPQTYEVVFQTGPEVVRGMFVVDPLPEASISLNHTAAQQLTVIPNFEITGFNTHFETGGFTLP